MSTTALAAERSALSAEPDERPAAVFGDVHPIGERFTGRDGLLADLERCEATTLLTQSLGGLGGVGTTTLAAAYAHGMRHVFDVVWWVLAETVETLETDLETLAGRLGVCGDDPYARARAALGWAARPTQPWLVSFDNATSRDVIEPWLPTHGYGRTLMT